MITSITTFSDLAEHQRCASVLHVLLEAVRSRQKSRWLHDAEAKDLYAKATWIPGAPSAGSTRKISN
jgi:hypothetical protein